MKKRILAALLAGVTAFSLAACSSGGSGGQAEDNGDAEETEIQVFIAASLNTVMTELAEMYHEEHPEVKITYNPDSSGTLLTQIREGYECDIFFSAAQKQMDDLEADGLVEAGTRADVVNNQVVVVARKDSGTSVTGLENIGDAESIALAGGSVPAGRYTRQALINMGMLPETDDPASITTEQVSEALGGVEISEQDNVSKVLAAVVEGSCEVGTTYYSDTYGYEDDLDILQAVSYDLTGNVTYPIARVVNEEADEAQSAAADDFLAFILSDEAGAVLSLIILIRMWNRHMEETMQIIRELDWSPLFISLKTGTAATVISFFLGIFAARKVVKASPGKKAVIDGILTLPMVLPPTAAGFFLLLLFSRRRPLGEFLFDEFGFKVVQTWLGCVIAATVIAFPLMYRNARAAMEQIDANLVYAARTLGMSEMKIFWKVIVPTAGPGIASGTILTFARALGEYGATSMLAGNIPGKTGTISQKIAMVIQDGDYLTAGIWVAIVLAIAFLVIFLMNLISGKKMKNIGRW